MASKKAKKEFYEALDVNIKQKYNVLRVKLLGAGTYGEVWEAKRTSSRGVKQKLIIKFTNIDRLDTPESYRYALNIMHKEMLVMEHIKAECQQFFVCPNGASTFDFRGKPVIVLFTNFLDGFMNMEEAIQRPVTMSIFMNYVHRILQALAKLHTLGIAHRDMKLENILVKGPELHLIDFGLSAFMNNLADLKVFAVNPYQQDPALLLTAHTKKFDIPDADMPRFFQVLDVFQVGLLLYHFVFHIHFWQAFTDLTMYFDQARMSLNPHELTWEHIDAALYLGWKSYVPNSPLRSHKTMIDLLLKSCLIPNWKERPSAHEILRNWNCFEWFWHRAGPSPPPPPPKRRTRKRSSSSSRSKKKSKKKS